MLRDGRHQRPSRALGTQASSVRSGSAGDSRRHDSPRTERAFAGWIRRYVLFHGKGHPNDMGEREVPQFLSSLASDRHMSASTQNQALSALLFLYGEVFGRDLDWLDRIVRAQRPVRVPVVLSRPEVEAVLARLRRDGWSVVSLMYGSGLRLSECAQLRVNDADLERLELVVRDGKGRKDRVMLRRPQAYSRYRVLCISLAFRPPVHGRVTTVVAGPNKLNPADRRAILQPPLAYWVIEFGRLFVRPLHG